LLLSLASSSGPPDGFIAVNIFLFVLRCVFFFKKKQLFFENRKRRDIKRLQDYYKLRNDQKPLPMAHQ